MLPTVTIDIGTTNVKVGLFDEEGGADSIEVVPTPTREDGWGEIYDARALERIVSDFIGGQGAAVRSRIQRITVGGVGESGAFVSAETELTSPLILWHDQRGRKWIDRLSREERGRLYRITGLPASANYGLSKAAWALERIRAEGRSAAGLVWLNVSEYLAARMTGKRWSEYSLASRTLALDVSTRSWSAEACALFGLSTALFPELRGADAGTAVSPGFAARAGLPAATRVHVVGHDHMVGAVGAGLGPGELLDSTGTTEGLVSVADEPRLDARAEAAGLANGVFCAPRWWSLFGSIPTGGSAFATLQTMLDMAAAEVSRREGDLLEKYLAGRIDLSRLPVVLPRFRGAPLPTKDIRARGVVVGLRTDTTADEIILATFVGLAFQYRDVVSLFDAATGRVKVIGPAAKDRLWLQLKADVLGVPHSASTVAEVVSRGAQALASGEDRRWDDWGPVVIRPDRVRHARLAEWFESVRRRWERMKEISS